MKKLILLGLLIFTVNSLFAQDNISVSQLLDNNEATKIEGQPFDGLGRFVSSGDLNGDNIDDLILGIPSTRRSSNENGGFYFIPGQESGFPSSILLDELWDYGFRVDGNDSLNIYRAEIIPDLNDDGIDEFHLTIVRPSIFNDRDFDVVTTIHYGSVDIDLTEIDVNNLEELEGFQFARIETQGTTLTSVKTGDINGDGRKDLFVLAADAYSGVNEELGELYIILGRESGIEKSLTIDDLNGENGCRINLHNSDFQGSIYMKIEVVDIDNDGIDDVIITYPYKDGGGFYEESGEIFIIYGNDQGFEATEKLENIGINMLGFDDFQYVGFSISSGDINGDSIKDVSLGGPAPLGNQWDGIVYTIFGSSNRLEDGKAIRSYIHQGGNRGFDLIGAVRGDKTGFTVKYVNYNGDDYDDLIVSATESDFDGLTHSGSIYIIYGSPDFNNSLNTYYLQDMGSEYLKLITGEETDDYFGIYNNSGDLNGDGLDDLLISSSNNGNEDRKGAVYIIYGKEGQTSLSNEITDSSLSNEINLNQNYPNPFNPNTVIGYRLTEDSRVSLKVFDMLGREVTSLVQGQKKTGYHQVNFDASSLTSGVYIYRLETGDKILNRKMTLIK